MLSAGGGGARPDGTRWHQGAALTFFFNQTQSLNLKSIVCYSDTFEINSGIKRKFTKYLKKGCCLIFRYHFFLKYVPENAFNSEIFPKSSGLFWSL